MMPRKKSKTHPVEGIDWPAAIHRALKSQSVRQVSYVPDAGHKRLIELCHADKGMTAVPLTTEEEGVALAAGAWLGGGGAAPLLQARGGGQFGNALPPPPARGLPPPMLGPLRREAGGGQPP